MFFFQQIVQAICNHCIWGSFILLNATTESSSSGKTVAMIDGGLLTDTSKMKVDVLAALNSIAESWQQVKSATISNCFMKCELFMEGEHSNVINVEEMNDEEKDDYNSLNPSGVKFKDYVSCDASATVCNTKSVDEIMQSYNL